MRNTYLSVVNLQHVLARLSVTLVLRLPSYFPWAEHNICSGSCYTFCRWQHRFCIYNMHIHSIKISLNITIIFLSRTINSGLHMQHKLPKHIMPKLTCISTCGTTQLLESHFRKSSCSTIELWKSTFNFRRHR